MTKEQKQEGEQNNLGNVLKILRGDHSLRDLEKLSGISNPHLQQIESGKVKSITIETLKKLLKAFPNHKKVILKSVGLDVEELT